MYNNVYGDYINNMLGTNPNYNRMETMNFENTMNTYVNMQNLEQYYPDLYKLLYPMIQNVCMKNTNSLSEDTINNMVEEVYSNFMANEQMFDEVDLDSEFRSKKNSGTVVNSTKNTSSANVKKESRNIEVRQNNYVLRDLIRILLLRELLGRPENRPPTWQQRPPFMPPFRPPFNPRDYAKENTIYESNFY